jgi:hypothetical protein
MLLAAQREWSKNVHMLLALQREWSKNVHNK